MSDPRIHDTIDAVWRIEQARLLAGLARIVRDVDLAEDLAQDALLAALEHWPAEGMPAEPRRVADDRGAASRAGRCFVGARCSTANTTRPCARAIEAVPNASVPDLLKTRSTTTSATTSCGSYSPRVTRCSPPRRASRSPCDSWAGSPPRRSPARFSRPRHHRAARGAREAHVVCSAGALRGAARRGVHRATPRVGAAGDLPRLQRGLLGDAGDDWMRPALCEDALRLGRILASRVPDDPEVHGLLALMEIQASRLHARCDRAGDPVLLLDQNRAQWDQLLIQRGLGALAKVDGVRRIAGPLCAAGGPGGVPRAGAHRRGDRLDAHRGPLRRTARRSCPRRWWS